MKEELGIIIPVYNEAGNIQSTISAIEQKVRTLHKIYIVYDFNEDNTLPVAKDLCEAGMPIEFLKNPARGVANAIKTGLRNAGGDYLLVTMADLSDDYSVVDEMCSKMIQGYDIVCGSRYMKGGRQIGGPFLKKFLSRTVGLSLRYAANLPTHDATNSFKLYRKSAVDSIGLESNNGFEIGMEIVVKAHIAGLRIAEVPCTWMDRQKGESRFKLFKWAPKYLKWYFLALRQNFTRENKKQIVE